MLVESFWVHINDMLCSLASPMHVVCLQDIAFFHHRLTLDTHWDAEREQLLRRCCEVLRDVAAVFDYDPAFVTLFYEGRGVKQDV